MDMPLHPSSMDIAFRLILTVLAGAAIGINREAGGHSAGFRTTVLVGLAAALSMIQANILLDVDGKTPERLADEMGGYVDEGYTAVKMKVGRFDLAKEEERIAAVRERIAASLRPEVQLERVRVTETETSWAEYWE